MTLDPAHADNGQAFMVMAGIYDTLYTLDPVSRTAALVPLAAAALPEVSADARVYTIRVRSGIFFAPHPSFGGRPRELTAADFAYSMRRILDPALRSPNASTLQGTVADVTAVDRTTLRITLAAPDPLFVYTLASPLTSALAREAVEAEGEQYGHRPVGTGGYLAQGMVPGQRLTLVRNPAFRGYRFDDLLTPASRAEAAAHPLLGRTLPAADRVELIYTPEYSAELLALRNRELDFIVLGLPGLALKGGRLKDEYARAGLALVRPPIPITSAWLVNLRNETLGGTTRERIALRRAMFMAFDDAEYARVVEEGAQVREQLVPPGIEGHVPGYRNPNRFDREAANALLDRFGYRRGADGMRRNPDGSALVIQSLIATHGDARIRGEFTKRMLDRVGLRVEFEARPDWLAHVIQCKYGTTEMNFGASIPDGADVMSSFLDKHVGSGNPRCVADAQFDAAYQEALAMPPGPRRTELFRAMQARLDTLGVARPLPTSEFLILKQPYVVGPFGTSMDWLQVMTLGLDERNRKARR